MNLKLVKKGLLHIFITAGCLIMIYPLLWMVSGSLKDPHNIFGNTSIRPSIFTLENYIKGWAGVSGHSFGQFFANTFIIVGLVIVGNIVTCSMAAYAFGRLKFDFKKVFFATMLVTMMLPSHVTLIPQYIIFNKLDWVNTYLPLTLPKFLAVEGFFIFLIVQFVRGLPKELDQAATVDGCGPIQIYWRLIIPLTLPALVTTAIFSFIWTWNDFFSQLLYLSDVKLFTVALGLRMFLDTMGESSWGPLLAMSTLTLIPVFVVFIFFQRYLIEGITGGGLKG